MARKRPTFLQERALLAQGCTVIAGVDEAGMGAWAGPVVAAAAVLPLSSRIALVRDSKLLSAAQRSSVAVLVRERATAWAVGVASAAEVDALNVRAAGALAMRRAVKALSVQPDALLIDAFRIPGLEILQRPVVRGDLLVKSIAAASILAKVHRDELLVALHEKYPEYGFAAHKGYGTAVHAKALTQHGPCAAHRMTYAPVIAAQKKKHRRARSRAVQ